MRAQRLNASSYSKNFVFIHYGSVCGYGEPGYGQSNPIISETNEVLVTFRAPLFTSIYSDYFNDAGIYQGFQIHFQLGKLLK